MSSKTALVLGVTGGIGRPVAELLAQRGWTVRAMHRDPARITGPAAVELVRGDAMVAADVASAARGVDMIVHAVKPRDYGDWHRDVLPMIDNSIAAANGARIVIPGNVYNYSLSAGPLVREDAPQEPDTVKGRLRVEMERRIQAGVERGMARALIVRAGDFFGPGAGSSWFSEAMVKPGKRPRTIRNPGKPGVGHQWVYLPDLAETIVQLMEQPTLPDFARFHMDGHWDATGTMMSDAIRAAVGEPLPRVAPLPWWLISLAAPLVPSMREFAELRYLWEHPLRLCNDQLVQTLGAEPRTPLDQAVRTTLRAINVI